MATFDWAFWGSAGPAWTDMGTWTYIFNGTGTIATPVTVGAWNDDMHIGDGDPGADQCGANHSNHNKYIDSDSFDDGGGSELLNETNLTHTECVIRVQFVPASAAGQCSAPLMPCPRCWLCVVWTYPPAFKGITLLMLLLVRMGSHRPIRRKR